MSDPATWYGIASLAASGLAYKSSADATKDQKQTIRRAGEAAQEVTKESVGLAQRGAEKYNPNERQATEASAETDASQSLGKALVDAQNRPSPETAGRVSDDYLTSKANTATERTARGTKIAQMMARLQAPQNLRFSEGINNADTVSKIGANTGDARNIFRGGQVDASGITPDGRYAFAGDALQAGAGAYYGNDRADRLKRSGIYGDTPKTYNI